MTPLADQSARDRISEDLATTLFVEAGAGTGKTHSLVERILRLVATGAARIDQVAAITFTEAAAAELRDRVLVTLERAARDAGLPVEERRRCEEALGGLNDAAIETLHAFAMRILSMHPIEAGLPPGFEVADETRAAVTFEARWSEHLDAMLEDPALALPLQRALAMGAEPKNLRDLAVTLAQHWDRLAEAEPFPGDDAYDPADATRFVLELLEVCAHRSTCADPDDKLVAHLGWLDSRARLILRAGDEFEQLGALAFIDRLRKNLGRQDNWGAPSKGQMLDDLEALDVQLAELKARAQDAVVGALANSLREFVLTEADRRRREGRLEFQDLLVLARNLLRDQPHVRTAVRERYARLLIDEFQDTDPLQTEIAFLLAVPGDLEHPGAWNEERIEAGRLFFVGDPKQSIYRFRRADIELYQRVRDRVGALDGSEGDAGAEQHVVRLTQNFRSQPGVIAWVNALFERMIGRAEQPGQAAYIDLHAHRPARDPGEPAVYLLGGPVEGKVDDVRAVEAPAIARALRRIKGEGWLVRDDDAPRRDDGAEPFRPARYQDVAILAPARTSLPSLLEALEAADIPYRLESRSLVYATQEVQDLVSILRALDDPTNEVALVAALRSPAFACGDDDLYRWHAAGGRWNYRRERPASVAADDPVAIAMAWLREAYLERWWMPVAAVVERVIRERRLFELAFVDRRPRERWQRLRFVLDQARAFQEAGGRTLREFLGWMERQKEEDARVVELVVPEADDDAVRIMTVHAAKGLQFPIVLLTGLGAAANNRVPNVLWTGDRPEVQLRRGIASAGYDDAKAREQALEAFEDERLLYVAATRAMDHLVVNVHHAAKGADRTRAARIRLHADAMPPGLWAPLDVSADIDLPAVPPEAAVDAGDRAAWLAQREAAVAARGADRVRSATSLAKHAVAAAGDQGAEDDPNVEKEPPAEEVPPWRRGRAGTSLGRAVHSVLQTIDLATGEDLEAIAAAQAVAEGVGDRAPEVARRVDAALQAPSVRAAVASGRYWRELYAASPIGANGGNGAGDTLVEGFVDLLYETPEGYVVVDYKTDSLPSDAAIDDAVQRYRLQLAAYALLLAVQLDRPVTRAVILFLGDGRTVEREVPDLEAAMADVRASVAV